MPHATLLALLSLGLLAGCDLGPDYARPALDIPAAFRATAVSAATAWPATEWWHAFGSAELDGLIADARAHNQDLAAAAARVVQADATVAVNGAPLLPTLSGTGNASYSRVGSAQSGSIAGVTTGGSGVTTTTNTGAGTTTQTTNTTGSTVVSGGVSHGSHYTDSRQYSLGLSASYEADFWGKNRAAFDSAKAAALASRFDQQTVALTVVTSVATTYFQALGAADRLAVARRNLADSQALLKAYQVRMQVGTATALDVAQEQAVVAGVAAQVPALQSTLDQQVIGLGILTGRPPEAVHITANTLTSLPVPEIGVGLPSALLARRPDVAYAEANLVAQNGNVRAARAAFFPDLTLTAQGGIESLALSTLLGPGNLLFTAAASLTQPIFDNGLHQGDLDLAKGRFAELIADYRKAVLQAFTDVDNALTAVRYTAEQEALERTAVDVAQHASDIARAQLAAGTIDITTLLNTQAALYTDQDTLASVRLTHFQALINLYQAVGGGFTSASASGTP
jgi:NodT family efflux transporter outer membrane factor (OMF) lipoprotein